MTTIPDTERRSVYNPVVATTEFDVDHDIVDTDDVSVYVDNVKKTVVTDYNITGSFVGAYSADAKVVVVGLGWTGRVDVVCDRSPYRTDQFADGLGVPAADQNSALNRLAIETRENYDKHQYALRMQFGASGDFSIPVLADGEAPVWNAALQAFEGGAAAITFNNLLAAGAVMITGAQSIADVKTFTDNPVIPAQEYGAGWNGKAEPATKHDIYTKIQTISGGTNATPSSFAEFEAKSPLTNILNNETFEDFLLSDTANSNLSIGQVDVAPTGSPFAYFGRGAGSGATGNNNAGIGPYALANQVAIFHNAAVFGSSAGRYNSADYLVAGGYLAGAYNTTKGNTTIGGRSGHAMLGGYASYYGYYNGYNSDGIYTISMGAEGAREQVGPRNAYIGSYSGWYGIGGNNATLGYNSANQTGADDGVFAGKDNGIFASATGFISAGIGAAQYATGDYSIAIGAYSGGTLSLAGNPTAITGFTSTTFTITGHGLTIGKKVLLRPAGTTGPTGYSLGGKYWFTVTDADTVTIAGTQSPAPTDIGTACTLDLLEGCNFIKSVMLGYNAVATADYQFTFGDSSTKEVRTSGCFRPGAKTRGSLPAAADHEGGIFYITDATSGRAKTTVFSDGANWISHSDDSSQA